MDYDQLALTLHEKYKGKITTALRDRRELGRDELSAYYSPGVAAVSRAIADNPANLSRYTWGIVAQPSRQQKMSGVILLV